MKMAFPTNSIRFINGEMLGMSRLSTSPAKNAPKIPSNPAASDSSDAIKTIANTNIYCATLSLKRRRKYRATLGNTTKIINPQISAEMPNFTQ